MSIQDIIKNLPADRQKVLIDRYNYLPEGQRDRYLQTVQRIANAHATNTIAGQREDEAEYIKRTGENPRAHNADPMALENYRKFMEGSGNTGPKKSQAIKGTGNNKQVGVMKDGKPVYRNSKGQNYFITDRGGAAIVSSGAFSPVSTVVSSSKTVDNKVTNKMVDEGKLPENQRENIPQEGYMTPYVQVGAPDKKVNKKVKASIFGYVEPGITKFSRGIVDASVDKLELLLAKTTNPFKRVEIRKQLNRAIASQDAGNKKVAEKTQHGEKQKLLWVIEYNKGLQNNAKNNYNYLMEGGEVAEAAKYKAEFNRLQRIINENLEYFNSL